MILVILLGEFTINLKEISGVFMLIIFTCDEVSFHLQFNQVTVEDASSPTKSLKTTKLVLEADEETVEVHKDLICKLKPHQVEGHNLL